MNFRDPATARKTHFDSVIVGVKPAASSQPAAPAPVSALLQTESAARWLRDLALVDEDDCFFSAMGRIHRGEAE